MTNFVRALVLTTAMAMPLGAAYAQQQHGSTPAQHHRVSAPSRTVGVSGKVVGVDPGHRTVTLSERATSVTYTLASDARIMQGSRPATFSAVRVGERVTGRARVEGSDHQLVSMRILTHG